MSDRWGNHGTEQQNTNIISEKTISTNSQTLYCPANAHNAKNEELLKQSKIKKAAPTCFGLQGNHHQRATAST